jgi:hypothetical protein
MARTKKTRGNVYQKKRKHGQDPDWHETELVSWHRVLKRFCSECRSVGHASECCNMPTKAMSTRAHVPKKHASKARWDEFFKAFPSLQG